MRKALIFDVIQNNFWAFLLASRRSRRAAGYAIASVRCTMLTHALRMPNAKEVFFMWGVRVYPPTRPQVK